MRVARFFVDEPLEVNTEVALPERIAHHAARVLRLRDGDSIVLFNGTGGEFGARLSVSESHTRALVDTFSAIEREATLRITLVQSWVAADKLDWIIEKAVELGVHSIVMAPAQRSVVRIGGDRLHKKVGRLRELVIAACAQCGRNRIPNIEASPTLAASLQTALARDMHGMLLHPGAELTLVKAPLRGGVAIAVGPEGGFDAEELALAGRLHYAAYCIGPRVLRTETAGLAALAALQAVAGDFC